MGYLWPIVREMIKTAIEQRLDDTGCTMEWVLEENAHALQMCEKYGCDYILIEDEYQVEIVL